MSHYRELEFVPEAFKTEDEADVQADRSWNPDKIGPLSRCNKCFNLMNGPKAYCSRCGHISTVFNAPDNCKAKFPYCSNHKDRLAVGWCDLHAKPICEKCDSEGKDPEDYFDYTVNLECKDCVAESKALKKAYSEKLKKTGSCSKHSTNKAIVNCKSCKMPLCKNCAYNLTYIVIVKKNLFKKIEEDINEGPYCLGCVRSTEHGLVRDKTARWSHVVQL